VSFHPCVVFQDSLPGVEEPAKFSGVWCALPPTLQIAKVISLGLLQCAPHPRILPATLGDSKPLYPDTLLPGGLGEMQDMSGELSPPDSESPRVKERELIWVCTP
jgi:hypothetical protein